MDRYEEDMRLILESIGADRYVSVPHRNQTGYEEKKSDEVLNAYLQKLPKDLIKRIYEKVLFGLFSFWIF